jgi:EF hand
MNISPRLVAIAFGILATSGWSPHASAEDQAPGCQRPEVSLKEGEGTADSGISAEKHAGTAAKRFEMMDADHDGRISAAEINASHGAESIVWANHPESTQDKIRSLDTNRDGTLTIAEYSAGSQKMFRVLDADGNGVLTPNEMLIDPRR